MQHHSAASVSVKRSRQLVPQGNHIADAIPAYDIKRTLRLAMYSGLIGSPLCFSWFKVLDKFILPASPKCVAAVLLKVLCDQALFAPVGTALYLGSVRCLEGRPWEVLPTIKQRWRPCLTANYFVWPAAHLINFSLVPPTQRILYVNIIAVFWGAFMSQMVNKGTKEL